MAGDLVPLPTDVDPDKLRRMMALTGGAMAPPAGNTPDQRNVLTSIAHDNPLIRGNTDMDAGKMSRIHLLNNVAGGSRPNAPATPAGDAVAPTLSPIGGDSIPASNATSLQPIGGGGMQPGKPPSADEQRLQKLQWQDQNPWGTENNHPGFGGKLAHIGSRALNIAGDVLDPKAMAMIPGTEAHRAAQEQQLKGDINKTNQLQSEDTARKASAENQAGELGIRGKAETRAQQHEDFEEGKADKPGTTEQETIKDLETQKNPKTGKNYTPAEAEIERAQRLEDTKPGKAEGAPKTVAMLDKPGGKPYEYQYDPKGNYSGDEGYGQWKKVGPAQPNAAAMGLIGTLTPLLGQNGEIQGTMNTKTGEIKPVGQNAVTGEGATTGTGARLANTERNQFNTQYVKPATDIEQNFQKFIGARKEYDTNPQTGAASMAALAQHLGSTFGSIKGAQMGEHMIQEHKEAIGLMDRIGRYADQLSTGQQLSKSQWDDFQKLITNTRDIQWETTAREASRRGQKVDFLPADVHMQMADSQGHSRYVTGDKVQDYLEKGAKIQ